MSDAFRVKNGPRTGSVTPPSSKSEAHRALICAALSGEKSEIIFRGISDDIRATAGCLSALLKDVKIDGDIIRVGDAIRPSVPARADCGESGSTLRFLLPLCGALGLDAVFEARGRLPSRPLSPLDSLMREHGATVTRDGAFIGVSGKLVSGDYSIPGDVSSQFVSGLLFSLPLLDGDSRLEVTGKTESAGYIRMTLDALAQSGIQIDKNDNIYYIPGRQQYRFPERAAVGADWSGAAFFLCAGALSERGVRVQGLSYPSSQGDSAIVAILERFGALVSFDGDGALTVKRGNLRGIGIDASDIPDLVPVLATVAAAAEGKTEFYNAGRLRLKESDRLEGTAELINSLGGIAEIQGDTLRVTGTGRLRGGFTDSRSDHRLAMSAAVAAAICDGPVTVSDPACTAKSYPGFWNDLGSLETEA